MEANPTQRCYVLQASHRLSIQWADYNIIGLLGAKWEAERVERRPGQLNALSPRPVIEHSIG